MFIAKPKSNKVEIKNKPRDIHKTDKTLIFSSLNPEVLLANTNPNKAIIKKDKAVVAAAANIPYLGMKIIFNTTLIIAALPETRGRYLVFLFKNKGYEIRLYII